jgi:hypothetical protein
VEVAQGLVPAALNFLVPLLESEALHVLIFRHDALNLVPVIPAALNFLVPLLDSEALYVIFRHDALKLVPVIPAAVLHQMCSISFGAVKLKYL